MARRAMMVALKAAYTAFLFGGFVVRPLMALLKIHLKYETCDSEAHLQMVMRGFPAECCCVQGS